jgi:hypothetical protein
VAEAVCDEDSAPEVEQYGQENVFSLLLVVVWMAETTVASGYECSWTKGHGAYSFFA